MLSKIQKIYDFSDYQMAQLKYCFLAFASEASKFAILMLLFHNQLSLFLFSAFIMLLIRINLGGIHCKTYLGCLLLTISVFVINIWILSDICLDSKIETILLIVSCLLISQIGPVPAAIRTPPTEETKKRTTRTAILVILIYIAVIHMAPGNAYIQCGFWSIILHMLQYIISFLKKGEHKHGSILT